MSIEQSLYSYPMHYPPIIPSPLRYALHHTPMHLHPYVTPSQSNNLQSQSFHYKPTSAFKPYIQLKQRKNKKAEVFVELTNSQDYLDKSKVIYRLKERRNISQKQFQQKINKYLSTQTDYSYYDPYTAPAYTISAIDSHGFRREGRKREASDDNKGLVVQERKKEQNTQIQSQQIQEIYQYIQQPSYNKNDSFLIFKKIKKIRKMMPNSIKQNPAQRWLKDKKSKRQATGDNIRQIKKPMDSGMKDIEVSNTVYGG